MIPGWSKLTRDAKVAALARGYGREIECPACGRRVHVVRGYVTQHTDPRTWGEKPPSQCRMEFQWAERPQ